MTIDRGQDVERYQGVVPLEGDQPRPRPRIPISGSRSSCQAFSGLPWPGTFGPAENGQGAWTWRAGGLLVQKLTREGGIVSPRRFEEDWTRAKSLAETVEDHELLDPMLAARAAALSPVP